MRKTYAVVEYAKPHAAKASFFAVKSGSETIVTDLKIEAEAKKIRDQLTRDEDARLDAIRNAVKV